MGKLHLFNPENDLALACDSAHFTPPAAALRLSRRFASLPRWWADEGDLILDSTEALSDSMSGLVPAPWGWSRYSREIFLRAGVSDELLPTNIQLDNIRRLSHRRLTIDMHHRLERAALPFQLPPEPREISNKSDFHAIFRGDERFFIKSPWSGSGRGIIDSATAPERQIIRLAEGVIKHQGSVLVEKGLDKVRDFAMLFDMVDGRAKYVGLSVFFNVSFSAYSGNIIDSEDSLMDLVSSDVPSEWIVATAKGVGDALGKMIGNAYSGPVGVDMLTWRSASGEISIAPCIEINLRMTMGRVAYEIYRRHGVTGVMQIFNGPVDSIKDAILRLTPESEDFNMIVRLSNGL